MNIDEFVSAIRTARASGPAGLGSVGMSRAPAVADVMGGIAEDSGSLVLTSTLGRAFLTAAWTTDQRGLRVLRVGAADRGVSECSVAASDLGASDVSSSDDDALVSRCAESGAGWATPICLAVRAASRRGWLDLSTAGLTVLTQTDMPPDAEFGRDAVQAAACINAICRLTGLEHDVEAQARISAEAVETLAGMSCLRTALTALIGADSGALLQVGFHPRMGSEILKLPAGIAFAAVHTCLGRPTTLRRLRESRICAEMGHRMIREMQRRDGVAVPPAGGRLAAVTPTEYVERYRDRLPTRLSGKAFIGRFGGLRGLNGRLDPGETYKIRSRSEHHIYENRRVHEFVAFIGRARRNGDAGSMARAGDLMYASHWSHSQRCGIGGVEADKIVSAIRSRGPDAGLYGAKVTGGGAGGEVVVLLRDDESGRRALADAVAQVASTTGSPIETLEGTLPGAMSFDPPAAIDAVGAQTTAST